MVRIKYLKNKKEWWLYEDNKPLIGFDKFSDLKDHFKNSLIINKNKDIKIKSDDEFLKDLIFL